MNGIDTAVSSLLANRVDSLLNIAPGSAAATRTGAPDIETAPGAGTAVAAPDAAPASAQTALSAIALTLNAIVRSGGEATTAVLGQIPIWPAAPALDIEPGGLPLFDIADSSSSSSSSSSGSSSAATASASGTTAAANVAAAQLPVAALAGALQQTVSASGLFYEAHLAEWLAGQRTPAALAGEPQNREVAAAAQLALDWADEAGGAGGAGLAAAGSGRQAAQGGAGNGAGGASGGVSGGVSGGAANPVADGAASRPIPSIRTAQAARFVAGEVMASSLSDLNSQPVHGNPHNAGVSLDLGGSANSQTMTAAVHPATVPLVRQQLDMLATGQFRWTGEAWPGAPLDWTIEQEGDEWNRSGGGAASDDDQPWRTRLTLSLPTLGTIDADLTLTGSQLVVRVQASPGGAARLTTEGESFRQRLAAAGIDLSGLTIREIGGNASGSGGAGAGAAAQAASAYARSASAATSSTASSAAGSATHAATSSATAAAAAFQAAGGSVDQAYQAYQVYRPESDGPAAPRTDFDWEM
ncbi:flagellar hook-length control protein FliK [Paraburkholderia sp. BCC1886]|uniref:flagellar hook-length control protein FliK n=1 Tax=Paraburkholderia sp. BCC1886 TaxID=2562670 RepID=UPI0011831682|nr:flagellar hook-length control protein FliK [Paraburkholderia sp. BCC1886]